MRRSDTATPFCNTLGTAQLCQATMSPRSSSSPATSTAVTPMPSTAVTQSSMASSNWTITTNTVSSTTAAFQNKTSAGTQQLIVTSIFQSFIPLNTLRIATTFTSSPTTTGTIIVIYGNITTSSTIVTVTSGASTTSVTDSAPVVSSSLKTTVSTSSGYTLQLRPTEPTISPAPIFTGGSTLGCSANGFTIAIFGLLLAVFL